MLTYTAPTRRSAMTKPRRVRIFVAADGKCGICGLRIRDGEKYEIHHRDALIMGGSDTDDNLVPVHVRCHAGETKKLARDKAKRDRIIDAGYAGPEKRKHRWPSRSFASQRYTRPSDTDRDTQSGGER